MAKSKRAAYGLGKLSAKTRLAAPVLPYEPRGPKRYNPPIGLIGCGGISEYHLKAYKHAGYNVVALCDRNPGRAEKRRDEFFPKAEVHADYRRLLARGDIEVVDITTHPEQRPAIVAAAIDSGRHVLSQKPFAVDLNVGRRLVERAERKGVKLAVNQNGRWAPHFAYMRAAVAAGVVGRVNAAHLAVHWNHNWIKATPFDKVRHVVLYDFAIHWFDILSCLMGETECRRVYASCARTPTQTATPAMLGQALLEFDQAQATLVFDADAGFGQQDTTTVVGSKGTLHSTGPDLSTQKVTLATAKGVASPALKGTWFREGFHGTMAELLCAVEEKREPSNSARNNLRSLALCFAAVASAERGRPMKPGDVTRMPK
ncbi:MAG: Gfo/Idh/MocA family oxidoreductase [Planctomycetota bacterium]|nr:Gfo/Idh/MocA family oxidoreductase [Planctomycetota bacterium]